MTTNQALADAGHYLQEVLGLTDAASDWARPWTAAKQLPFVLQEHYAFYETQLFGKPCLFMLSRAPEGETPAVVRKHREAVAKHFSGDVIYLVERITSFNRKRLIEQRVPFVVPGNQCYLPMLGVDLRERFKHRQTDDKANLSAAAQAVLIREILYRDCTEISAKDLAYGLGYSAMTMSRAMKELENKQLVRTEKVRREKRLYFKAAGRELWQAALPALQSPVKKRVWVAGQSDQWVEKAGARLAGEAAMTHYTMLAGPELGVWAVSASEWPGLKKLLAIEELAPVSDDPANAYRYESGVTQVELWAYNPALGGEMWVEGDKKVVDPLSLWLSLDKSEDERLDMAKASLLEQVWKQVRW